MAAFVNDQSKQGSPLHRLGPTAEAIRENEISFRLLQMRKSE